jgi:hypothetical protein
VGACPRARSKGVVGRHSVSLKGIMITITITTTMINCHGVSNLVDLTPRGFELNSKHYLTEAPKTLTCRYRDRPCCQDICSQTRSPSSTMLTLGRCFVLCHRAWNGPRTDQSLSISRSLPYITQLYSFHEILM